MGLTVPYTGTRGGGGEIFVSRTSLMTLVIYVLIDVKFNEKR